MEDEEHAEKLSKIDKIIAAIFFLLAFSGLIFEFNRDSSDKYGFINGDIAFVESKCIIGSIFNKDTLILNDKNVTIKEKSFFSTTTTLYQYKKIGPSDFSVGGNVI